MKYFKTLLLTVAVILGVLSGASDTRAAQQDLLGWAWSSNLGWISFNSANNDSGGGTYSVRMDDTTGNLNGYAWSPYIGWIKFDSAVTGCPSGSCAPKSQLTGPTTERGVMSGWARACSAFVLKDTCAGAERTDGWTGWISLSDQRYHRSRIGGDLGVYHATSTGIIEGFAWGAENMGWTRFYASVDPSTVPDPSFSVSCVNSPQYVSGTFRPRWTASATGNDGSGNPTTFTYTWTWNRPGSVDPVNSTIYRSSGVLASGQTWSGPTLTVLNNGTNKTQTKTCPSTSRGGSSSGSSLRMQCVNLPNIRRGNKYYPRWEAVVTNAVGDVEDTWTLPMSANYNGRETDPGLVYESTTDTTTGSSFAGLSVRVKDDADIEAWAVCDAPAISNPDLKLRVNKATMTNINDGLSSITVKQGDDAYSYIEHQQIIPSSCFLSPQLLELSNLPNGQPDLLVNRKLDTTKPPGDYVLQVYGCDRESGGEQPAAQAVLKIIRDVRLEEI